MKIKKKVTRFLEDGNAIEVFVCVSIVCVALVVFYVLINLLFPKGENYLKLAVAGIFSLGGVCISTIFAHKEKNRETVLKYVTEKRLSWIEDTRKVTADLCAETYRYVDIVPNINQYNYNVKNIDIETTNFFVELTDIIDDNFIKKLNTKPYSCPNKSSIMHEISKCLTEYKNQDFHHSFINNFTLLYLKYNLKGERDRIILQVLRELYKAVNEFDEQLTKLKFKELSYKNIDELYDSKKKIITILRLLVQHTQIYLKLEWERIKNESVYDGSVKHRREKIKRKMENDRLELYKAQKNFDDEGKDKKIDRFSLYMEPVYNRFRKKFIGGYIK